MKRWGTLVGAGLFVAAGGAAVAPVADATAPQPQLQVSPAVATAGQSLDFSAGCAGNAGAVTSAGLTGPVTLQVAGGSPPSGSNLSGRGTAANTPGTYRARFT